MTSECGSMKPIWGNLLSSTKEVVIYLLLSSVTASSQMNGPFPIYQLS